MRPTMSPRLLMCVALFPMVLLAIGCRATPTPTPTPTPEPTPTPIDVVGAFKEFADDSTVAGHGTMSATLTMGPVDAILSGVVEFSGEDWMRDVTTAFGGLRQNVREANVKGVMYRSVDHGPWVRRGAPTEADEQGALAVARAVNELRIVAEITSSVGSSLPPGCHGDGTVYHLSPERALDLPPSMLGIDDASAAMLDEFEAEMDFYVRADGYLNCAQSEVRWTTTVEGAPPMKIVAMTVIEAYEPTSIVQPADPWGYFVSEANRYAVGVPPGYKSEASETIDEPDVLLSPTGSVALVWTFRDFEEPLDNTEYSAAVSTFFGEVLGVGAQDGGSVLVDSREARILIFEGADEDGSAFTMLVGAIPHPDGLGGYAISHPYAESLTTAKRSFSKILQTFEILPDTPTDESPDSQA